MVSGLSLKSYGILFFSMRLKGCGKFWSIYVILFCSDRSSVSYSLCVSVCDIFSCEAQLNTCTHVPSARLKTKFHTVWSLFDSFWKLMTAYHMTTFDNFWQFMKAFDRFDRFDSLFQLTTAYYSFWQLATSFDSLWQILTAYDIVCHLLTAYDS